MADITIAGLGILNVDHVTRETERALRAANEVLYVDTGVATEAFLGTLCPRVTPLFGASYETGGPRRGAYHRMAARVVEAALDHAPVVFAMQGHPVVGATAPGLIARAGRLLGLEVRALPGISAMDCLFAELMLDPVAEGLQMVEATDLLLRRRPLQPDMPALIWQIGAVESCLYAAGVSRPERFRRFLGLMLDHYPAEHRVTAIYASPHPLVATERIEVELGRIGEVAERLHAGHSLYVPAVGRRPIMDAELLARLESPAHLAAITR